MSALQWLGVAMLASPFVAGYVMAWFKDRELFLTLTAAFALAGFVALSGMLVGGVFG